MLSPDQEHTEPLPFCSSGSTYGGRIARGAGEIPVSLGYDRVRFLKAVHIGDTITVRYVVEAIDQECRRTRARIEVTNQRDELVAVAEHILK